MLNPSIIKRGMDDEEYSNACPTIGTLMIAHFSTPERHRTDIYSADGLFFATHPLRHTYLRPAFKNEFDIDERETVHQERPTLWVLVSQLVSGRHMILPVWRGRCFWRASKSDSDEGVAGILLDACLRGGLNVSDWYSYISDQRANKNYESERRRKRTKEKVN